MNVYQPSLFDFEENLDDWFLDKFSANGFSDDAERIKLEKKYKNLTKVTDEFSRQNVSYQLSKNDCVQRWFKYKEGFSSDLVEKLIKELEIPKGGYVLDPFLGSGTTSFVCKMNGINSIGFDILPMTKISIMAKDKIKDYDISELENLKKEFVELIIPESYFKKFSYIPMTESAFPDYTEKEIVFYSEWLQQSSYSDLAKNLFTLCILNSLEKVSYTRKDGQYLSWDSRSPKIINANIERAKRGAKPIDRLNKGSLPSFQETVLMELENDIFDIKRMQEVSLVSNAKIRYEECSSLFALPKMKSEILDGVITSPPYCNRYDYTRTYALELNYLGLTNEDIIKLRKNLLSCTVESKSKFEILKNYYTEIGRIADFDFIISVLNEVTAFSEVMEALKKRENAGEINNKGVIKMVEGYFLELAFTYAEIHRLLKKGAQIAVVNDNVRYAGEVIPVDYLSCAIAETIGFKIKNIYTLKQKKGNSSQQMAKYGRIALRKSITIWEK